MQSLDQQVGVVLSTPHVPRRHERLALRKLHLLAVYMKYSNTSNKFYRVKKYYFYYIIIGVIIFLKKKTTITRINMFILENSVIINNILFNIKL